MTVRSCEINEARSDDIEQLELNPLLSTIFLDPLLAQKSVSLKFAQFYSIQTYKQNTAKNMATHSHMKQFNTFHQLFTIYSMSDLCAGRVGSDARGKDDIS